MSKNTNQFWDKRAEKYDAAMSRHDEKYDARLTHIVSKLQPSDHLLDFGCASGEIALDLAPHVKCVEGVDLSTKMVQLATQKAAMRNVTNTSFLATDIFDLRLEAESYDVITALNVLHLAKDHAALIPRLKQLLKPGGLLLAETPCVSEMVWWQKALLFPASAMGLVPYLHKYAMGEPEAELRQFGFEILSDEYDASQEFTSFAIAQKPKQN